MIIPPEPYVKNNVEGVEAGGSDFYMALTTL